MPSLWQDLDLKDPRLEDNTGLGLGLFSCSTSMFNH